MDLHEVLKDYEMLGIEVPGNIYTKAYDKYKEIYPNSQITISQFSKEFKKLTGFLIDENGKGTSLSKLVSNYINCLFIDIKSTDERAKLTDLYKMLYFESQNMSHGCGYLYFANQGAWSEDINVILFLDKSIQYILRKFCLISAEYQFPNEDNNDFLQLFLTALKDMNSHIEAKNVIFQKVPRVGKTF